MSTAQISVNSDARKMCPDSNDPLLFKRSRTWWLLLALFLMTEGNGLFTRQDSSYWNLQGVNQRYESSPVLLFLTVILWTICVMLMAPGLGQIVRLMLQQRAVSAFALLALVSTLWSQEPGLTFRRAGVLSLMFAFAWFFVSSYSFAEQRRLLLATGVIVGLTSAAMAIFLPQYGIASGGEWKGVFGQKNRLGLSMFYFFSCLPFCRIPDRRRLLTLILQGVFPIALIVLSQSKTSLIMMVVLIIVRIFGPRIAHKRRGQLPFIIYVVVVGVPILLFATFLAKDVILPMLGRDSTLTGRTDHWAMLAPFALSHLWLGYGYQAFWTGTGDSLTIMKSVGATMDGADSGYIDTMLQFGLVGMALLLLILLNSMQDFMSLFKKRSVPVIGYWHIGVILATYIGTFTEALFLVPIGITFVFVVAFAGLRSLATRVAL